VPRDNQGETGATIRMRKRVFPTNTKICSCDIRGGLHTRWEDLSCRQWLRLKVLADPHYQTLGKGNVAGQSLMIYIR
jgi:hypothetical protein